MHLASDYVHPTPRRGFCRVRMYLDEEGDVAVVVLSEVPTNAGSSVTEVVEVVAAEIVRNHEL